MGLYWKALDINELDLSPFIKVNILGKGKDVKIPLNEEMAEFLGFYLAEGSAGKTGGINFGFNIKEKKYIEKVKSIGEKYFKYKANIKEDKRTNGCSVRFGSGILSRAFREWFGSNARNKVIPDFILFNKDKKILKSFLNAYYKGDGCFYKNNITITTVSKNLALQTQLAMARFGIFMNINENKGGNVSYIRGRKIVAGISYHIKSAHDRVIEFFGEKGSKKKRKVDWFRFNDDYIYVRIRKIDREKFDGEVYNLQTKNQTYSVGNIVVHNCYKIIYDRIINDEKVNKNWLVIGCGNLDSDRAFTHTLPSPLRDRGGEVELSVPTVEDWTTNFAIPNKMDSRIIGFVNFKQSSLHKVNFDDNQKFVTPRGWERINTLIKDVNDWNTIELLCNSAIGEGTAVEFVSFCKISEKLKLEDVIKNPEKIRKIEKIDVKYFLVSDLAERYSDSKNKSVKFAKIMEVSKILDEVNNAEFVALLWKMCSSHTKNFKKDFISDTKWDALKERFGKYII